MSDSVLQELVVRMATDPGFADLVRTSPGAALGGFDLTSDEVTQLTSLSGDDGAASTGLATRQSKSSLFFMGGHEHVAHDPGLGQAGHVNLHDSGAMHHGPGGAGEHHADGGDDVPIMLGTIKHDGFVGSGGHAHADGGDDVPIMIGDIKHDMFTGGVHPGDGANVELHGSGPIE